MIKVLEKAFTLLGEKEPYVMATVVRTKGSTPQKVGARMLIREDGSAEGTLGGGCVEGDIWYWAREIFRTRSGPQFRKYELNEDIAMRDGLVCGGTMYFYIEPVWSAEDFLPFAVEIQKACQGGPPVALATLVNSERETGRQGARLLVREDGSTLGTLGTPELDARIVKKARQLALFGHSELYQTEAGDEIFVEGFTTPPTLVLMGGGHVGKAVSALAATLGFRIFVVDDRPEFANRDRFPEATETIVQSFDGGLGRIPISANTYILIATRGHRYDDMALKAALNTPACYVGLVGSKRKSLMIYKHLVQEGVPLKRIKQVHAPVGLDIGAVTPAELAVSIMGEIIMSRRGGTGASLKMSEAQLEKVVSGA